MNKKFENVPLEKDTVILFEKMHNIDVFDCLYQIWQQGIYQANSVIFLNEDVEGMSQEAIEDLVKQDAIFVNKSSTSFTKSDSGYTFVNFNFQEIDDFNFDLEAAKKSAEKHADIDRIRKEQIAAREKDQKLQRPV